MQCGNYIYHVDEATFDHIKNEAIHYMACIMKVTDEDQKRLDAGEQELLFAELADTFFQPLARWYASQFGEKA